MASKKSKREKSQPPAEFQEDAFSSCQVQTQESTTSAEKVSHSAASEFQEESAPTCPTASSSMEQAPMEVDVEQAVKEPIPMVELPEQAEQQEEIVSPQTETAPLNFEFIPSNFS